MTRTIVAIVAAALAAGAVAPAAQAAFKPPRSCASGEGEFRDGKTRIFSVEGSIDGDQAWRYYVCSASIRKPRRFYETSPGLDETLHTFRVSGRRVAFVITLLGGESFDQELGWVDLRSARRRLTGISDEHQGFVHAVVADEDGGIAYVQEGEDPPEWIGYARIGPRGYLGRPRRRAGVEGGVVRRSLAVADGTITWTTRSGASGSVPTSG